MSRNIFVKFHLFFLFWLMFFDDLQHDMPYREYICSKWMHFNERRRNIHSVIVECFIQWWKIPIVVFEISDCFDSWINKQYVDYEGKKDRSLVTGNKLKFTLFLCSQTLCNICMHKIYSISPLISVSFVTWRRTEKWRGSPISS